MTESNSFNLGEKMDLLAHVTKFQKLFKISHQESSPYLESLGSAIICASCSGKFSLSSGKNAPNVSNNLSRLFVLETSEGQRLSFNSVSPRKRNLSHPQQLVCNTPTRKRTGSFYNDNLQKGTGQTKCIKYLVHQTSKKKEFILEGIKRTLIGIKGQEMK